MGKNKHDQTSTPEQANVESPVSDEQQPGAPGAALETTDTTTPNPDGETESQASDGGMRPSAPTVTTRAAVRVASGEHKAGAVVPVDQFTAAELSSLEQQGAIAEEFRG